MTTKTSAIALFAVVLLASPLQAQEAGPGLIDLMAHRLDDTQVAISFTYQGGACEEVLPATLGETTEGSLAVTFPTRSTAEICTMQVKDNPVEQTISADASVTDVDVTLLATDGSVAATGTTAVASH